MFYWSSDSVQCRLRGYKDVIWHHLTQAASAELFTFRYFMHICGQISCNCWSEGWDQSIGSNSICVFMVMQILVGLNRQGRLYFHCVLSYSLTVTLPITLKYCILILSKLISLHFKRLKAQGGSLRVLSNYADTHTHTGGTQILKISYLYFKVAPCSHCWRAMSLCWRHSGVHGGNRGAGAKWTAAWRAARCHNGRCR